MHKNKPEFIHDIQIGIGDVCKITGVSGRQLRYWEERGYIHSLDDPKSSVRKYSLDILYKVGSIKHFIDEGYTLAKAVEKSEQRSKEMMVVRHFMVDCLKEVKVTDLKKGYGELELGTYAGQKVVGIRDENGSRFEMRPLEGK
ncbi:MerR family transcriptional regulator [Ligilactobacillus faecis]|uniref:MerR family transcriptional regulator n=1 Tax=Ligilactobacillus faecis TaxID=762833 RepID=UPI00246831CD|nr:MerR family transcriptional regulator [Ligilactobacillus faecis]WGN90225.1 MerR family transcriptional regulator [Ligilactobacillus faecis]